MNLQRDMVTATLRTVAEQAAAGSVITFDFFSNDYLAASKPGDDGVRCRHAAVMRYLGESIRFTLDIGTGVAAQMAAFLAEPGLRVDEIHALWVTAPDGSAERPFGGLISAEVAR